MTSLVLVAALMMSAPEGQDGSSGEIFWRSYSEAVEQSRTARKPVAVFFGTGKGGFGQVATGGLTKQSREILVKAYLPVFVDTTTSEGKRLAQAFELKSKVGLVVSDRTGGYQMLFHEGTIDSARLEQELERLREADARVSFYPPQTQAYGAVQNYSYGTMRGAAYCPT